MVEELNVEGLLCNGNIPKHVAESSWSKFLQYLSYKVHFYERQLIVADSFYPSSKLCSFAGTKTIISSYSIEIGYVLHMWHKA